MCMGFGGRSTCNQALHLSRSLPVVTRDRNPLGVSAFLSVRRYKNLEFIKNSSQNIYLMSYSTSFPRKLYDIPDFHSQFLSGVLKVSGSNASKLFFVEPES